MMRNTRPTPDDDDVDATNAGEIHWGRGSLIWTRSISIVGWRGLTLRAPAAYACASL